MREYKPLIDLLSERSLCYRNRFDAQARLQKVKTMTDRVISSNPEFASEHSLWKAKRKEAEGQMQAAAARCDELDAKIYDAFAALRTLDGTRTTSDDGIEARLHRLEASLETIVATKVDERTRQIRQDYETRQSELKSLLEQQAIRIKGMEDAVAKLSSRVDESTAPNPGAEGQSMGPKDTDNLLPILNETREKTREKLASHEQRITDLENRTSTATSFPMWDETREKVASHDQQIKDLETKARTTTPGNEGPTRDLELRVVTLREMFKDTLGDVKAVENRVSKQEASIAEALTNIEKTRAELEHGRPSGADTGGTGPGTGQAADEGQIRAYVESRIKAYEDSSRAKWGRIMDQFDKVMKSEADDRKRLEEKVESSLAAQPTPTATSQQVNDGLADLQTRVTAIEGFPSTFAAWTKHLEMKTQADNRVWEDLSMRIGHLAQWRDNFSTNDLVNKMVVQIANNIPKGTMSQLRRLDDRLSTLEAQLEGDGGGSVKRRKTTNGDDTGEKSPAVATG